MAPTETTRPFQLLVEGNDERNFFEAFIEHMRLLDVVQIQVLYGKDRLRDSLEALAGATGFPGVKSIGIVRDADESARSAFQSVQTALMQQGLPAPDRPEEPAGEGPSVSVLILPGDGASGMLETLLCKTFAHTAADRCIDEFFRCARKPGSPIHRPDKARAQAYLATQRDPHVSVGVGAKKRYWKLDHAAFDGVRRFLRSLVRDRPDV